MNRHLTYFKTTKFEDEVQYVLRLFGVSCWASVHAKHIGWFRLFGVGFMWKNVKWKGLLFSEWSVM